MVDLRIAWKNGSFMGEARRLSELALYRLLTRNKTVSDMCYRATLSRRLNREFRDIIARAGEGSWNPTPSNQVWVCWLQGLDNAPPLVRACHHSLEKNLPNRDIVFLTEKNIPQYIELPGYVMDKYRAGLIGPAHYSDILRVALLCEHGGLWADATVLCTAPDFGAFLKDQPLFLFKNFDLARRDKPSIVASNWLISACPQHSVLTLTRDLLYAYWKKYQYVKDYFIFHLFFTLSTRRFPELWDAVPAFNNHSPHTMQFELSAPFRPERWEQLMKISDFHKLTHHTSYPLADTIYGHVLEKYGMGGTP